MRTHEVCFRHALYQVFLLCASIKANTADELDALILNSIIPGIGNKCKTNSVLFLNQTSSFSFNHEPSPSIWDSVAIPFEQDLFLAEMTNTNTEKPNKSWTFRVGQAGNIYSFRGAYGEAIPPQYHLFGQWVDEVTQSVSVNLAKNNDPKNLYFIHQAGVYMQDEKYTTNNPFFSPNIAKHCSIKECLFGSWGQQAHLPTIHESQILYFNSYRDCGDGVLEITSVIHNSEMDLNDGDSVNYLNVPWGGVRQTTLRDLFISKPDNNMELQFPLVSFGLEGILDFQNSGGFTTFAEQVVASDELYSKNPYKLPTKDGITLKMVILDEDKAIKSIFHSDFYNSYCIKVPIIATFEDKTGCQGKCHLCLTNRRTGDKVLTQTVLHWSWNGGDLYFCTDGDITEVEFNDIFKKDDEIIVSFANTGKPIEDNLALTFVHGTQDASLDQRWAPSRLRYGKAGISRRDYTVFTTNPRVQINPGDTYVYQQYIVTGELSEMEKTASVWKSEVYEDLYPLGEMSGVDIHLYSTDATVFGAFVTGGQKCLQGVSRCIGKTVPQPGLTPLFSITCGNSTYLGSNQYFFSPPRLNNTDLLRSYACVGEPVNVRPEWKLLGFFEEGSCNFLKNATYHNSFCSTVLTNSKNTSFNPSFSPTSIDDIFDAKIQSTSPTMIPTEENLTLHNGNQSSVTIESLSQNKTPLETLGSSSGFMYGLSAVFGKSIIFLNILWQLVS